MQPVQQTSGRRVPETAVLMARRLRGYRKRKETGLSPGVAVEEEGDEEGAEEEGEEGREAVAMPSPMAPPRKEREQHELTHTPYRSWCPHCVRARGRNRAHRANREPEKSGVPSISFDYFFFSDEDEKGKQESHASHG